MDTLENISRSATRRKDLQKIVLRTIATAGLLAVAVLAPNVLQVLGKLGLTKVKRQKEIIILARERLVKIGLLAYKNGFLKLTPKGEAKLRKLELNDFKFKKPKQWDKKWRMLIFDIKEKRREVRDKVRRTLVTIGFRRLQHSVWIYPYPCEDLVTLLKADFEIGSELLYIIADTIEYDARIRKSFGL